ncbi:MAG: non-canonical purine NTP pyrophosphatase [Spirochaetes bacterium]|nr:non-canonical purine NTP pyrophosphatase [Spirochaetota bacterium]MBU1081532.1 non-canonical purine NTP pyrophosphatase [Spirochaetota bacterium]
MILYMATNNAHKLDEIRLAMPGVDIRIPSDAGIDFDFPENEDSFLGNSTGKALALWRLVRAPVLADDSGLCVDALGGRPGVLSARYGSLDGVTPLGAVERNDLLLSEMAGVGERSCRFVCCMSLVMSPDRIFVAQETCEGELLKAPRGSGGFGYDPVVFLPGLGKSVAELGAREKNAVSHRGRAIARMAAVIDSLERMG